MSPAAIADKLTLYERLMRLDKPIGILLLLWPTLWALWLASGGRPQGRLVWIFALGTVLMRSAGCVMNDIADWRYDAEVKRTRDRPLATGAVSRREALVLASVLTLVSFVLVLSLNRLTVLLSFAALGLAAGKTGEWLVSQFYPQIPFAAPWWAMAAAPLTAIATAALFTVAPAARATRLDPVAALSRR